MIDLKTTNGKIVAKDIKGSTNCKTTNGSIKVYLEKIYPKEDMTFKSTNGSIKVYLPDDTNADVEAKTTNGSISCDLPVKGNHRESKRHFYGEINDGGPLIYLKTTNGSIRIYEI
jgi:lia operon protein LiaG